MELHVLKLFTIFGTGTSYPIMSHKVENNKQKTKAFFIIVSRDSMVGGFGFLRRIRRKKWINLQIVDLPIVDSGFYQYFERSFLNKRIKLRRNNIILFFLYLPIKLNYPYQRSVQLGSKVAH